MPDPWTLLTAAAGAVGILLACRLGYEYGHGAGYVEGYRAGREVARALIVARHGARALDLLDAIVPTVADRAPGEWTEEYGK